MTSVACRLAVQISVAQSQANAQARATKAETDAAIVPPQAKTGVASVVNEHRKQAPTATRIDSLLVEVREGDPDTLDTARFASRVYSEMQKLIEPAA
ncbi:hypothetical protein ATO6_06620 [Oceanicola sp. 22II-s10i]|nr:hypothetical protein ATO6_06620 [Oceanicola sp. 22II-s10i]